MNRPVSPSRSPEMARRAGGMRKIPNAVNQFSRSIRNERAVVGDNRYDGYKDPYQMNDYDYQDDQPGPSRTQDVAAGLGYYP